jgi:hypothetical protein
MKIIHFGCWNLGKCAQDETNGLTTMTKLLNKYCTENKDIDFISIAGDNYYPNKSEVDGVKIKKINKENLLSGFGCLPHNVTKYVILGNHDIEDITVNDEGKIEKCESLTIQQKLKLNIFNDIIKIEIDDCLILMIDTTLYEFEDTSTNIIDTCYNKIPLFRYKKNESKTIQDLINYQNSEVDRLITETTKNNIIIIGHHPIIGIRFNKKGGKTQIYTSDGLGNLFKKIKTKKNLTYMCADIHAYQEGIVKINELNIHQFIVGTGGGSPDLLPPTLEKVHVDYIEYEVINQSNSYGFLLIEKKEGSDIKFTFIGDSIKDFKYKYLKYKKKYLSLKEN